MRDQDNAILKAYGININEKNEIEEKPKKCPRCDYLNPSLINAHKQMSFWIHGPTPFEIPRGIPEPWMPIWKPWYA